MKHLTIVACGWISAISLPAFAASPLDGTWKADMASAKLAQRPDSWSLKDGVYECTTCTPPYKVLADGKPHPVAGKDYWDALAVEVVDANTLKTTTYRKGEATETATRTVSADGSMITFTGTTSDNANGKEVTSTSVSKRVSPAPAGAHATSGSWQHTNDGAKIADEYLTLTLAMSGNTVDFSMPTGERYSAKLGGPRVPVVGDKANTMVALKRDGAGFTETDYVGGKPVMTSTYLPVDATTARMKTLNLRNGSVDEYVLKKQ